MTLTARRKADPARRPQLPWSLGTTNWLAKRRHYSHQRARHCTLANDAIETAAIKAVFGERAASIPISATKALHGHLLGAAGALECVLSLLAMEAAVALPTMHLQTPDPECDLDYVPNAARATPAVRTTLSNSFAFGGTNAVLVLGAAS